MKNSVVNEIANTEILIKNRRTNAPLFRGFSEIFLGLFQYKKKDNCIHYIRRIIL